MNIASNTRLQISAEEELKRLYDELQISDVVSALRSGDLPDRLQALVVPLTTTILDLFGTGTPTHRHRSRSAPSSQRIP